MLVWPCIDWATGQGLEVPQAVPLKERMHTAVELQWI